ncbi:MAG: hypothetical protein QFX33_02275 [Candidatus Nezhaarchaeota archaeon]|nr:hypothetical protein [Candidatus Nezhaarchaeota archaeon]
MARKLALHELEEIVELVFEHFKKPWVLESEFSSYLKSRGCSDGEASEIWFQALGDGLIEVKGVMLGNSYELAACRAASRGCCW